MIALLVCSMVLAGYIGANVLAQRNNEELNERTVAIQNANQLIEQIRTVANTDPFPDSVVDAYPDNSNPEGFNDLPQEVITVSYEDASANPLVVTVTVTWQSYTGRECTETIQTHITQRG